MRRGRPDGVAAVLTEAIDSLWSVSTVMTPFEIRTIERDIDGCTAVCGLGIGDTPDLSGVGAMSDRIVTWVNPLAQQLLSKRAALDYQMVGQQLSDAPGRTPVSRAL